MVKAVTSPKKFVVGKGILQNISEYTQKLGNNIFIISDAFIMEQAQEVMGKNFEEHAVAYSFVSFNGECSRKEINRIQKLVQEQGSDVVIGIGGGKTLDTAKAVAYYENKPVIIIPTIASTDAPTSALSVIYTETGEFEEYLFFPSNPDMVLADTEIIANAPVRFLVAGMGDALSTYFEARACSRSNANNMSHAKPSNTAMALSKLCYETLLEDGFKAKLAVENNLVTKSVENIIEANIYLSGIGFESGGLAAAHAIHNGLTCLEEAHHFYHGEKVAFATIVQLVLENAEMTEIVKVINFCMEVGLPTTLGDLGVKEINKEALMKVAEVSCADGETIFNMPFEVTPEDVFAAIITADQLGKAYK